MKKIETLKSTRLVYEPLGLNHLSDKYVNWMNDRAVNIYMESGGDYTIKKLKSFLLDQEKKEIFFWAIIRRDTKKHIGNIKIDPINSEDKSGEYGIMIGDKSEWGKGYANEASTTLINYCFNEIGLNKINLGVNRSNNNALKLYDKLGFVAYDRKKFPDKYKNVKEDIIRMTKNKFTDKIILGTAQFGMKYGINNSNGKIANEEIYEILEYSYDSGIRKLDTAEAYGNSIDLIGEFHNQNPKKKFKVFSKATYNQSQDDYLFNINNNLKKLSLEYYEGYMIHNYKSLKENQKLINEMYEAKRSGLIKHNGVSLYFNEQVNNVLNESFFDFIQLPFNLLDNSSKRESTLKFAKSFNLDIHARSIFLQGLFFKPQSLTPKKLRPLTKYINQLTEICKDFNLDLDELAIKYTLNKDYINKIIFGIDSLNQLKRNVIILENVSTVPNLHIDKINVLEKNLLNPTNW